MPKSHLDHHKPSASFRGWLIISDQIVSASLAVIWRELAAVLAAGVEGDIAEFGCYIGTTSLFLRRLLDEYRQSASRKLHVYDSFAGLPEKRAQDASSAGTEFASGELAVSKKALLAQFRRARLAPPSVHKAWFRELGSSDVPPRLAFAFLDGDFYDSIAQSLALAWPRLSAGGRLIIDDYQRAALPGVTRAIDDFFGSQAPGIRAEQGIAVIRKI
jgi:O-methyltransferase